ncbi:MAG: hypothetical protein NZ533_03515 [Casimicrobiaceae bacterium]|nr:hypothetical protein [Casimicrobiaceae bacterium]MDW8311778.1 hypothetical protein [Burkholderiales bacterium]
MSRSRLGVPSWLSAQPPLGRPLAAVFALWLTAALASAASRPAEERPSGLEPPNTALFTRLCTNTADLAECGKKIEAELLRRPGASSIARRDGRLLAITIPGDVPYLFEDQPGEAGPDVSFYGYVAPANAVVLYRARGDRLDFLVLDRSTGSVTELPNEPKFNRDGRYFATADFCKDGCENRIAVWRLERRGAVRERVFAPRTPWDDAEVSWGSNTRLIVDVTEGSRSYSFNLDVNDPRWTVLSP